MEVITAVAHYYAKAQHKKVTKVDEPTASIDPSPTLTKLVESVLETYNNKHAKQAGIFEKNLEMFPFSNHLDGMLKGGQTLFDVATNMVERFTYTLNQATASTGGHLFMAHYNRGNEDFLLIVKLGLFTGYNFSDLEHVHDAKYLSLDKLQVAARINLTEWQTGGDGRYVTFVSTREGGNTTGYFKNFIGCDVTVEGREESKKLVAAVDAFTDARVAAGDLDEGRAITRKQAVFDHAMELAKQSLPVVLAEVGAVLYPEDTDAFIGFLANFEDAPVDNFHADRSSMKGLTGISFRSKDLTLSMSHSFREQHKVSIDGERLVIHNPPKALIKEFE